MYSLIIGKPVSLPDAGLSGLPIQENYKDDDVYPAINLKPSATR